MALGCARPSLRQIVAANGREIHEHIGRSHGRFEDAALLMGRARFADDLPRAEGDIACRNRAFTARSCGNLVDRSRSRAGDAGDRMRRHGAKTPGVGPARSLCRRAGCRHFGERSLPGRGRARGREEAEFETSLLRKSDFFVKFVYQMAARKAYAQRSSRIAATTKS